MTRTEILEKISKGDFTIDCTSGRRIYVDKCNYIECWAVTTFEVVGTYWDSDYRMRLPIRDLSAQRQFLTDAATADYIMELINE